MGLWSLGAARMRIGLAVPLWCVVAVTFALTACGPGTGALKGAARVADELATVVNSEGATLAPLSTEVYRPPPAADVQSIIMVLDSLETAERGSDTKYDRDDWRHWVDDDRDCQNTRAEVLIEESLAEVDFASNEDCRVVAGEWLGPWSGEIFTDASEVDIDHHVPLGHAHEAGGWAWDSERKRAYANDMSNPASLQVTKAALNRAKGKQPPDRWRPDDTRGWCQYAGDWVVVKARWELTVTEVEKKALLEMLDSCSDDDSWGLGRPRSK